MTELHTANSRIALKFSQTKCLFINAKIIQFGWSKLVHTQLHRFSAATVVACVLIFLCACAKFLHDLYLNIEWSEISIASNSTLYSCTVRIMPNRNSHSEIKIHIKNDHCVLYHDVVVCCSTCFWSSESILFCSHRLCELKNYVSSGTVMWVYVAVA